MPDPAVDVHDLVKVFKGGTRALDGLSITVEPGTIFALLGPNGSGKTTLMRILTTQIKATSGTAGVFGLDVVSAGKKIRNLISYVPQEMSVWTDITGYENVLIYAKIYGIPSSERKQAVERALDDMGLVEAKNRLVKTYSGGMVRRLEITSALLIKPRMIFLDEPTIGLDPSARKTVWEKVLAFQQELGMTVFFNTHYMDEADMYSNQITLINRGKEVVTGKADALKAQVGNERIRVSLACPEPDAGTLSTLRALDGISEVVTRDQEIDLFTPAADAALPGVIEALRVGKIGVNRISTSKPSLDDVFLKHVGSAMESSISIKDIKQTRKRIGSG